MIQSRWAFSCHLFVYYTLAARFVATLIKEIDKKLLHPKTLELGLKCSALTLRKTTKSFVLLIAPSSRKKISKNCRNGGLILSNHTQNFFLSFFLSSFFLTFFFLFFSLSFFAPLIVKTTHSAVFLCYSRHFKVQNFQAWLNCLVKVSLKERGVMAQMAGQWTQDGKVYMQTLV